MFTEKMPKNAKEYYCKICDFRCSKKSNYTVHLNTRKHKMLTNVDIKMPNNAEYICECGKSYKHRQSLYVHKKKCEYKEYEDTPIESTESAFEYLLKENMEMKKETLEMKKENLEMKKMMIDLCQKMEPISNNTNINSHNTHNKIFNIQVFLNEDCKDAMNMTEFIESIQLSIEDVEKIGSEGQTKALSNILVDKLNNLDIVKRPVHCSDIKKEIIYVKDENKWGQESKDNPNLKRALDKIAVESMSIIPNNTDSSSKIVSEILKYPREDDIILSEVSKKITLTK